jgi:hypothetical protein
MTDAEKKPSFNDFGRWLASRHKQQGAPQERYEQVSSAARSARNEFVQARAEVSPTSSVTRSGRGSLETLQLLAAADKDASLPPEIVTPRGFRIALAYDDGGEAGLSLGVFVTCPADLSASLEGQMAYLWCGDERFELGQFDAEGKALGALPPGYAVSAEDFASGRVQLEVPV